VASKIVPEWHALEVKREALERLLLEKHRIQLDNADPKEKKRIKKQIEKQIEQELREESKKAFGQKPWIR
jgi:coenzyme F420-reducing hydrogenase delta subunit